LTRAKPIHAKMQKASAKMSRPTPSLATIRPVESLIRIIRGHKVVLDSDLAAL
jgi:hypothetical protein